MAKTRLTKTGQPVMGTSLDIWVDNITTETGPEPVEDWETCKVVGKLHGPGGNADLVEIIVEWEDGIRQRLAWCSDLTWRETTA